MKRFLQTVNFMIAGVQFCSELKELVNNFQNNLRYHNNEDQPAYNHLFSNELIRKAYLNPDIKLSNYGHFIIANSKYIAVVAVQGNTPASRKSVVLEFKEHNPLSIEGIQQLLNAYAHATLIVNDNGEGKILGELLKKNGIYYMPVHWGGACFNNDNRKAYINKRALAYVSLGRALQTENFKIRQSHYKEQVVKELSSIQYSFVERSRFKIMSVSEMREIGHDAPDIADMFAQVFLENATYSLELNTPDLSTPANNTQSD